MFLGSCEKSLGDLGRNNGVLFNHLTTVEVDLCGCETSSLLGLDWGFGGDRFINHLLRNGLAR